MNRRTSILITAAALALAGAAGRVALTRTAQAAPAPGAPAFSERGERDVQIRVWKQALEADPVSAAAMGQLAALHLQRAREGGTWDDYLTAEQFARRSLALRTNRNAKTALTLATDLVAQHRFAEARDIMARIVRDDPDVPQYRSLLGEIAMELGDDSTAERMFTSLWADRAHLSIAPRLARWAELNGRTGDARRLLESARDEALTRGDVPKETKAWFQLRAGELALRKLRPRTAEAAFRAGLAIELNDPRLQGAMARLAMARGDARSAIEWGDRAIATVLDPGTLGVVGDAYAALGDSAKAEEYYRTMEVAVTAQPGPYHRAWSLHLLDHGLRVDDVLRKSLSELEQRHDVYGYDIAAWALHRAGRDRDAEQMMHQALRLGTRDPLLLRHAGVISAALDSLSRGR